MDFDDYDDFSHDNNPFSGSNHYYANGILSDNGSVTDIVSSSITANSDAFSSMIENQSNVEDQNRGKNKIINHNVMGTPHFQISDNYQPWDEVKTATNNSFDNNLQTSTLNKTVDASDFAQILSSNVYNPRNNNFSNHIDNEINDNKENIITSIEPNENHNTIDNTTLYNNKNNSDNDDNNNDGKDNNNKNNSNINHNNNQDNNTYKDESRSVITEHPIKITGYEILRDYKNLKTVFYKIELDSGDQLLRRYSDFASLRLFLLKLFQTRVIPPIPEKHSLGKLIRNPFNFKSDKHVIEQRIRMLNYFLDTLRSCDEIRNSNVLKKFLDPQEKNWEKVLHNPPFTTISSRSILLTSSRNPNIPNPYLTYLPNPSIYLSKKYNSKLNSSIFFPLECKIKKLLNITLKLESCIKKLIKDLQQQKESMAELGGLFNIFSIMEDYQKLVILENFGNKIDMNFLGIDVLIRSLIIKVKEPLLIYKLTLRGMLQLLNFRKLKELQLSYFQDIVLRKQSRMRSIIAALNSELKLQEVLHESILESPSLNRALENLRLRHSRHDIYSSSTLDYQNLTPVKSRYSNDDSQNSAISKSVQDHLLEELQTTNHDLTEKYIPCLNNLRDDVHYLSIQVENNINSELNSLISKLHNIIIFWKIDFQSEFQKEKSSVWNAAEV